ncbi:hypothetical protein SLEP1_g11738 [Rubroshorea leprosula]|nr:hypothetical protein SLEP1_g11738 [Rubroshorea leprosula]
MDAYSSPSSSTGQEKVAQHFHSSLHSVRRLPMKPWKKPIAPMSPTRPRVYKVDAVNFRNLVQKLTGAPEFRPQPQRLHSMAPPPKDASSPLFGRDVAATP